nr:MAG TPA: hypothetical protein [Caudoviricetes sp.]
MSMQLPYDAGVGYPASTSAIAEIAQQLQDKRLGKGESVFIPEFPLEHTSALNSALITGMNVAFYTNADSVYGGKGVRIYSLHDIKNSIKDEQRFKADLVASKSASNTWKCRIEKWFGFELDAAAFFWDGKAQKVFVATKEDDPDFSPAEHQYRIGLVSAFAWMSDAGSEYRGSTAEPPKPTHFTNYEMSQINVWQGVKQVVWMYDATDGVVSEHSNYQTAMEHTTSFDVEHQLEQAPLIAWLAYNAAKDFVNDASLLSGEEPVVIAHEEIISTDELEDL